MVMMLNPALDAAAVRLPSHVAIVGAGTIGPDIGYYFKSALPGSQLTLIDIDPGALQAARERILRYIDKAVSKRKMSAATAEDVRSGINTNTDYDALCDADWVLEAASENLALKRKIFTDIEARVSARTLLTSNTSSIPAERIFAELRHPERATVTHFFAPAFQNPIVEVIDWPRLDRGLLAQMRGVFALTGKVPLVTRDVVCFMLDRIFDNWCNEAALLLPYATAAQIDSVAQEFVTAGPFYVLNFANGNPIIVETNSLQAEVEGSHYRPADVFNSVERWRTVEPRKPVAVAPELRQMVRDRLLGILFSQSVDILDRDIGSAADLELGARLAFGFESGPLALMTSAGEAETKRILQRLQTERPGMPMPQRALDHYRAPSCGLLVDRVEDVVVLTIRRPEALNALDDRLNDSILAALIQYADDSTVRGFVLTGFGARAFCSGADISRFPSMLGDAAAAAQYARDCSRVLVYLDQMQKPVVAALNGLAFGGGLELAMRCHALLAVRGVKLQFPEISLGIAPGIGAMVVPYRRWPRAEGLWNEMLLGAVPVSTEQAFEQGVIDGLSESATLLLRDAIAWTRKIRVNERRIPEAGVKLKAHPAGSGASGRLSATVQGLIAQAVAEAAAAPSLTAALEVGYRAFGASACTAAAREGIAAFAERRAADFSKTG